MSDGDTDPRRPAALAREVVELRADLGRVLAIIGGLLDAQAITRDILDRIMDDMRGTPEPSRLTLVVSNAAPRPSWRRPPVLRLAGRDGPA